jgi:hypothetical protein
LGIRSVFSFIKFMLLMTARKTFALPGVETRSTNVDCCVSA